jgi:hypothetical protein
MSGLSDALVYATKASGVPARKITQGFQTWNGASFTAGQVAKININGRSNQYVNQKMSYLMLKFTSTVACALDYSINSIIREISLYQGTAKLERIAGYNVLWHMLNDLQSSPDMSGGSDSIFIGTNEAGGRAGADLAAATEYTFCIPLMSSILGGGCAKMLPLAFTNDIRLEILFESNENALVAATGSPVYTVTELQYVAELVELDSSVQAMVEQQVAQTGGYRMSIEQWHNFACNNPNVATNSILIGGRFSSVKTLLAGFRFDAQLSTTPQTKNVITSRVNPFTGGTSSKWFWKSGNHKFPDNEVKSDAQAFAEATKALHNLSQDTPGLIQYTDWKKKLTTDQDGAYLVAVDTESQSHKSASLAAAGLSTVKNDMYLEYQLAAAGSYDVQVFVHTDN